MVYILEHTVYLRSKAKNASKLIGCNLLDLGWEIITD